MNGRTVMKCRPEAGGKGMNENGVMGIREQKEGTGHTGGPARKVVGSRRPRLHQVRLYMRLLAGACKGVCGGGVLQRQAQQRKARRQRVRPHPGPPTTNGLQTTPLQAQAAAAAQASSQVVNRCAEKDA